MTNATTLFNNSTLIRQIATRLQSEERGQSLMEMAIVLMFLLPLTFGIIDFSRCIYTASVVNAAAQEGARAGIIDQAEIISAIQSKMVGLDMGAADIDVDNSHPEIVEVNIVYNYTFITPMIDGFVESIELTGNASMVKQ